MLWPFRPKFFPAEQRFSNLPIKLVTNLYIFQIQILQKENDFRAAADLPACLSFTVTNMNGIEIIIQFFYAFFGEKRQAERAILFTFSDMK